MSAPAAVPFVIGQWVCGPRFYGRAAEIAALRGARRRWQWIAGLRRIGKTSLLKQLDHLLGAAGAGDPRSSPAGRSLPLFWDLQGAASREELHLSFGDALLDAEEALSRLGVALPEVEDDDLFAALAKLGRAVASRGTELVLLCDEADALLPLDHAAPGLVEELWRAVEAIGPARVILASSVRLQDAAAAEAGAGTASLLARFAPPTVLGVLRDDEARALLRQSQLPAAARPACDDDEVETLRERCGNHPMLLQIVAKRFQELGDLEEASRQVAADRAVQHLFAVDFDLLRPAERRVLRELALAGWESPLRGGDRGDRAECARLADLGLIHDDGAGGLAIPNRFLAAWLAERDTA